MADKNLEPGTLNLGLPFGRLRAVSLPFDALSFAQGHEHVEWSNGSHRLAGRLLIPLSTAEKSKN